ncbi:31427_t:CDS:2, partial [Racocetra persica]
TYTALTFSEISPIPFSCPRSYPYTSPKIKKAFILICYLQTDKKKYKSVRGNGNGSLLKRRRSQQKSKKQSESNTAFSFYRFFGEQVPNQPNPKNEPKKLRQNNSGKIVDSQLQSQLQTA